MDHFILDGKDPVLANNPMMWVGWFETANRMVAKTVISPNEIEVSTVFLGLNHSFGWGAPLLFETLVFGGACDGLMDRYSTWDEAEAGHLTIVGQVKERLAGDNVVPLRKRS